MMLQPAPAPLTKEQFAYTALRSAIIRCELAPGEKLIIDRLSAEMGLSQIPIRAAIQRLQAEGLVIINPHASATVAPLPPEKVDEIFTLLESLERAAFCAATRVRTESDLSALSDIVGEMDDVIANPAEWVTLNGVFHRRIAAISAMPLLIDFTNRALDEWERIYRHFFADIATNRLPQAQKEHRTIIELLRARDADALETLTATHNREANLSYQALLK